MSRSSRGGVRLSMRMIRHGISRVLVEQFFGTMKVPLWPTPRTIFRASQTIRLTGDGDGQAELAQSRKQDHTEPAKVGNGINETIKTALPPKRLAD